MPSIDLLVRRKGDKHVERFPNVSTHCKVSDFLETVRVRFKLRGDDVFHLMLGSATPLTQSMKDITLNWVELISLDLLYLVDGPCDEKVERHALQEYMNSGLPY